MSTLQKKAALLTKSQRNHAVTRAHRHLTGSAHDREIEKARGLEIENGPNHAKEDDLVRRSRNGGDRSRTIERIRAEEKCLLKNLLLERMSGNILAETGVRSDGNQNLTNVKSMKLRHINVAITAQMTATTAACIV